MGVSKWDPKDPNDIADYWFNFGVDSEAPDDEPFLPEGETIDSYTITVPTGMTVVADSHDDKTVRVRMAGGTDGVNYIWTCLITTSTGQEFESDKVLKVRNRITR